MQHILFTFFFLFFLNGCQDKEQNEQVARDAKIVQEVRKELLVEFEAKEKALKKALEEKEEEISQKAKASLLAEEKAKTSQNETNTSKLSQMGIVVDNGVITIDTNQTKDYFKTLTNRMSDKIKKMKEDFEKGMLDRKDTGVEISQDRINIDLNKTKALMDEWNTKIKIFIEEFDTLAKEIETNTTTKGN
ncbi:MAG TPA: hypothetical protein EYH42_05735 [Sulfurovum sp.]|nr:hypothetical protein [Sulfurovum sp.]